MAKYTLELAQNAACQSHALVPANNNNNNNNNL
jgi:hypothetical protein